jgi:hypothetical protein
LWVLTALSTLTALLATLSWLLPALSRLAALPLAATLPSTLLSTFAALLSALAGTVSLATLAALLVAHDASWKRSLRVSSETGINCGHEPAKKESEDQTWVGGTLPVRAEAQPASAGEGQGGCRVYARAGKGRGSGRCRDSKIF